MVRVHIEPDLLLTLETNPGETILEAICNRGYTIFYGCRRGGCGVCKVRIQEGKVNHGICAPQAINVEELEKGWVLACRAVPLSDVVVLMGPSNRFRKVVGFWPIHS